MNELDPYLFKKIKIFEIGRAENFLEPEQVERIPKNRKFENYRLLKKKIKKKTENHEFGISVPTWYYNETTCFRDTY